MRMKKTIIVPVLLSLMLAAGFLLTRISPYLYTKVYGNQETELLYEAYKMAYNKASLEAFMKYVRNNSLEYVTYPGDNMVTLHARTDGHGETVVVWVKKGRITDARFDDFL